jgi:hypothetical protein
MLQYAPIDMGVSMEVSGRLWVIVWYIWIRGIAIYTKYPSISAYSNPIPLVRVPSPAPLGNGRKIRGFGGFLGVGGVGTLWYGRMENMLCISIREVTSGGGSARGAESGIEGVVRPETRLRRKNLQRK